VSFFRGVGGGAKNKKHNNNKLEKEGRHEIKTNIQKKINKRRITVSCAGNETYGTEEETTSTAIGI
jgi:hypothetical protein